ncbi:MAG: hypothetical protein OXS28_16860 [Gammaproteobacteria bacterium]|nr:hypothetical protein [Gammaproteobacteria bacterium]
MPGKASMRENQAGAQRLPTVGARRRALGLFLLLQFYFAGNVLSFGFWKSSPVFFGYQTVFYGTWLAGLVLLLCLFLATSSRFAAARFDPVVLLIFSLPFCFGLWLQTLAVLPGNPWWNAAWIVPLLFVYYRFGVLHAGKTALVMVCLCLVSFMGHSEILTEYGRFKNINPPHQTHTLDRKTSIHVIVFDALTHSTFSNAFLGVTNPAADYLSALDDAMYADTEGFVEYVPTRNFFASLFELEKGRGHYTAFSGHSRSFLTDLLRDNGYYIQTGFGDGYMGASQGEYVDSYIFDPAHLSASLVCAEQATLLGFCSKPSQAMYRDRFRKRFKRARKQTWFEEIIDSIDQAERSQPGPVFSVFHIYYPGHTRNDYQTGDPEMFAEYKKQFITRTARVKTWVEDINRLRQQFPGSIFIVTGDHGPFLSMTETEDRRFRVLDRHAVALALLNATNLCPWSKNWLEQQRYMTPGRMLAASLACNGDSRKLTEHFADREEFIRFGESLTGRKQELK